MWAAAVPCLPYEATRCWGKRTGASPSCLSLDRCAVLPNDHILVRRPTLGGPRDRLLLHRSSPTPRDMTPGRPVTAVLPENARAQVGRRPMPFGSQPLGKNG